MRRGAHGAGDAVKAGDAGRRPCTRPAVLGAAPALAMSIAVGLCLLAASTDAGAQLSDPCRVECALVLGASSVAFAQGAATVVGRAKGGYSTRLQAITVWSAGFLVAAGAGIGLHGDGERQRRAVYASGVGALAGGLAGLALESLVGERDTASRFAATLIGAAAGVVTGGVIGAIGHDGDPDAAPAPTIVTPILSIPLGR